MKRKIIGFLVSTLLITTAIPFSVISETIYPTSLEILSIFGGFKRTRAIVRNAGFYETENLSYRVDLNAPDVGISTWIISRGRVIGPHRLEIWGGYIVPKLFGISRVYAKVTLSADNADTVYREEEGFLIGSWVII
ncbi:MAG: hypothetical protein JXA91_07485 [Candidatus Thermoplasmatota archaeon]|nr:hypothetical protein [Candidatus Thermoplasmatota archaeon]